MSSSRARQCFADIRAAVSLIRSWIREVGSVDEAVFGKPLYRNAIERQLLLISEAAIRLDKLDAELAPRIAPNLDWRGVRGMGNFSRTKDQ